MQNKIIYMLVFILCVFALFTEKSFSQRIYVENDSLKVNGNTIFINGANTPWNNWNDFGGSYDHDWWDNEFSRIKNAGGNATRIWITCSGEVGINIDSSGYVSGATQAHWDDLADMFQLARSNQIYILATLISFDHTKNTYSTYQSWRDMYSSNSNIDSFITNYVDPFVNRYKDNPYLFAIEPCNEIEWVNQNDDNAQLPWSTLQYFCARVVAAVHENSDVLATIGVSMKWQTDVYENNEGNQFSDDRLRAQYNDSNAYIDVYSPHFYDWVTDWFGNPMASTNVSEYGLTDKPVIIGELPANGVGGINITDCFMNGYENGLHGLMPWTSNGVDSCGSLDSGLGAALTNFYNNYPDLVYPPVEGTPLPTGVPTETPSPTPEPTPEPTDVPVDCSNAPEWDPDAVYEEAGMRVVYNGNLYESKWYSSGQNPEENSGEYEVWTLIGPCDSDVTPAPTTVPTETTAPDVTPGDVNSDGEVDIVDALLTAQFYVGLNPSGFNEAAADADCNGNIDIVDALLIAQYYVGLISGFC
jgi:hypothetical protein